MKSHPQTKVAITKILRGKEECRFVAAGDTNFIVQTAGRSSLGEAFEKVGFSTVRASIMAGEFLRGEDITMTFEVNGPAYLTPQPETRSLDE